MGIIDVLSPEHLKQIIPNPFSVIGRCIERIDTQVITEQSRRLTDERRNLENLGFQHKRSSKEETIFVYFG